MTEQLAEKEATIFRTRNGFTNNEPIRLKSLLQQLNIITVFKPLSNDFSGMALKAEMRSRTDRFMLINSNTSTGKQHFTVGHELYHLFIQPNFTSQICKTGVFDKKADPHEYDADLFASFLLLPSDGLLKNIPDEELARKKISLKTILFLENYFSCSRRALLYRLKSLSLIRPIDYDLFSTRIKSGARENGYDVALYEPGNHNLVIGDYGSLARELFEREKISQTHYYSLLTDLGIDTRKLDEDENGDC